MMVTDLDIYRSAKLLIDKHGVDARWVAARRSDEFLERGAVEGQKVWLRVLNAVVTLTETETGEQKN
jgi:hypothetical protein